MIIHRGINNYSIHKNHKIYIQINIDKLIIANILVIDKILDRILLIDRTITKVHTHIDI